MRLRWSLTGCLVFVGLAFRACHYLRAPSVWHDEAALLLNVIGKNFTELLGPLFFAEAAPPLFLWVERGVHLLLGDDATVLRLVPFLASCASLLLMAWTARKTLAPAAVPWAVLLFAASDRILWHCCEAKPYAIDMLVCALSIALYVAGRSWPLTRQLLLFAGLAPPLIFLSYPACFVLGAILTVFLGPVVWSRRIGPWMCYLVLVSAVLGAFLLLVLGPVHAQRAPEMDQCWVNQFPPWKTPSRIPIWTVGSTLDVFRYCFEPAGSALAALAALGAGLLWRGRNQDLLGVILLPLVSALAASFLGAYPYGGSRVEAFAAPGLALLVAAGVPPAWCWLQTHFRFSEWALAALLLVAPLLAAYHVLVPWRRADNAGAAAYILDHRQPQDRVAGNLWQDEYYFRRLGPDYLPLPVALCPGQRLWIVMTAWPDSLREKLIAEGAKGLAILNRRDFTDTTVLLVQREFNSPVFSAGQSTRPHSPP